MKKLNLGAQSGLQNKGWDTIDFFKSYNPTILHNLEKIPYPIKDKTYDLITGFDVLEHLNNPIDVLKELHRITKQEGKIHLKVPFWNHAFAHGNCQHVTYFGYGWFEHFVKTYNIYEIKKIKYVPFSIFSWLLPHPRIRKYASYFFGSIIREIDVILVKK